MVMVVTVQLVYTQMTIIIFCSFIFCSVYHVFTDTRWRVRLRSLGPRSDEMVLVVSPRVAAGMRYSPGAHCLANHKRKKKKNHL